MSQVVYSADRLKSRVKKIGYESTNCADAILEYLVRNGNQTRIYDCALPTMILSMCELVDDDGKFARYVNRQISIFKDKGIIVVKNNIVTIVFDQLLALRPELAMQFSNRLISTKLKEEKSWAGTPPAFVIASRIKEANYSPADLELIANALVGRGIVFDTNASDKFNKLSTDILDCLVNNDILQKGY